MQGHTFSLIPITEVHSSLLFVYISFQSISFCFLCILSIFGVKLWTLHFSPLNKQTWGKILSCGCSIAYLAASFRVFEENKIDHEVLLRLHIFVLCHLRKRSKDVCVSGGGGEVVSWPG